jgi:hypothetical protein
LRHSLLIDDITINIIIVEIDFTSTNPAIAIIVLVTILVITDTTAMIAQILEIYALFARNYTTVYRSISKKNKTLKRPDLS